MPKVVMLLLSSFPLWWRAWYEFYVDRRRKRWNNEYF